VLKEKESRPSNEVLVFPGYVVPSNKHSDKYITFEEYFAVAYVFDN